MTDVVDFPAKPRDPLDFLVGPFQPEWKVVIDGRAIPHLSAIPLTETGSVLLSLDGRFLLEVPNDLARSVASFIGNALAIGQGYPHLGADSKSRPFAPFLSEIPEGMV